MRHGVHPIRVYGHFAVQTGDGWDSSRQRRGLGGFRTPLASGRLFNGHRRPVNE